MITKYKKSSNRWSPPAAILIIILGCVTLPDAISTKASVTSTIQSPPPIVLRQIWAGPSVDAYGTPSSDGRYLSHTKWKKGDLAIRELATGKTRLLTETKKGGQEGFRFALNSVISPDGKMIAYSWTNQYGTYDLCVIGTDGSGDRTIYSSKDHELYPACWSSDGERIAARKFTSKGGYLEIISVSVADRSVQVLKTSERPFWPQFCYSPNDKFFVFDFPVGAESRNLDIFLLDTQSGREVPLVKHPANDSLLGWVPDHGEVLFLSDRTGTKDIWAIKVVNGKPQGAPRPIMRDVGQISPQGITYDGSLFFSRYTRKFTTEVIPFDTKSGQVHYESKKPLLGSNYSPEWSPDGESLVYVREEEEKTFLHILNVKTDRERILGSDFAVRAPRWSPDGRIILFTGKDRRKESQLDYNGGIYRIDIQDDKVTELVQFPPVEQWSRDIWTRSASEWTPDGNAFFYTSRGKIMKWDLESAREEQLYQGDVLERALELSPDGKTLAFCEVTPNEGTSRIMIIPVSGGESRELYKIKETKEGIQAPDAIKWTPDGNYVLFAKDKGKGSSVYRISSKGGDPEIIWDSDDNVTDLSIHPEGGEIAISTYMQEFSIWVMENFLPEAPSQVVKAEPKPTLRQIEVRGRGTRHSRPSFDGKYFSDVDKGSGNLIIRELATNKEWQLPITSEPNSFVYESSISPDSTRVAFLQFNPVEEDFDLCIINLDGTGKRTLMDSRQIAGYFNMDAWSPDGEYIFGRLEREPIELVRVSADDGSMQVIKKFDQNRVSKVDVSPDGRYLAYSYAEEKTSKTDIFIYDLEQNQETLLVTHTAGDILLGWTPDGENIFFTSDRNGTWDGWLLRVADGKAVGLPEMIKAGIGNIKPIGFTKDGLFYYEFQHQAWNVYTAVLDQSTGQVISEPMPIRHVGKDVRPDFSPDGRYLAYLSEPDRNKPQVVRIRTLATDQERELKIDLPRFESLRWCPDSRHLLITNFGWNSPSRVYKVDIETGTYTLVVSSEKRAIRQAELSADGKTLVYRIRGSGNATWLIARNIETGDEKEILSITDVMGATSLAVWSLSPDGKEVAYSIREGEAGKPFVLKIMSMETGESRTLMAEMVLFLLWSPDGRDVFFTRLNELRRVSELWRVSASGSEPRKLLAWKELIMAPRIHPDGQRIAFHSGGYVSEMWVMENFLPVAVASASE